MVSSKNEEKPKKESKMKNRGPWLVKRETKKGMVSSLRFPSEIEREKNKNRERMRRKISSNIYAGLRAFGGYDLPNNADNNQVLFALCEEAGWKVDEDGTITKKDLKVNEDSGDQKVELNLKLSL